jgi:hypothetical protein
MTDRERVKLLFGPYKAPPLKRGDRATCLFRDCTVIVTSWTDARIPWPRCRALDSAGGGSGLLVEKELARAVRHKSAAAVMHWWGASGTAVHNRRTALGVGRMDNEGSARLMLAAAEKGAAAVKAHKWTDEECDERSRVAVQLGVGRNLVVGYHGAWWTPEDIALLGTLPDEEVAQRTGRTVDAVRRKRWERAIPNPASNRWAAEDVALLGTEPDKVVAEMVRRSVGAVLQKRIKMGIRNRWDGRRMCELRAAPPTRISSAASHSWTA